jgi:hypothetical protein
MVTVLSSGSDAVRQHAADIYLRDALRRGDRTFSVNIGVVHKALSLTNRVPLVCAALTSKKFLVENNLRLISKTGPPSGQSTTVTLTYEILGTSQAVPADPFLGLRGIAKDVFKALGGGEAFIRKEREEFSKATK